MSETGEEQAIRKMIMDRIDRPGWTTTRAVLQDPSGQGSVEEHQRIESVMKQLADEGHVRLWRLELEQEEGKELIAAAQPGLELDKDLENRGAWAKAKPY
jgi:hypothetical protein